MLENVNLEMMKFLKEHGIHHIRLTSVGNSIARGHSQRATVLPLLNRNQGFRQILEDYGILVETASCARGQNNCERHIFEWFLENKLFSDIALEDQYDYSNGVHKLRYYPFDENKCSDIPNIGVRDFVLKKENGLANIIIYSGSTGSFLDHWSRFGSIPKERGVLEDMHYINAFFNTIQLANRKSIGQTQIYVLGSPKPAGVLMNGKLQRSTGSFACTTYVKPAWLKLLYPSLETGRMGFDFHYDEIEYQKVWTYMLNSIIKNYFYKDLLISMDRECAFMSQQFEFEKTNISQEEWISNLIDKIADYVCKYHLDYHRFLPLFEKYFLERYPHDFYYIDKKILRKELRKLS